MKILAAALWLTLAVPAFSAGPVAYRIELKGGVTYWSNARPILRSGLYVFHASDGTLMSIRKSDVASVRQAHAPAKADEAIAIGSTSPAAAARNQKVVAGQLRQERQRKKGNPLFRQDPYRPGVGLPYPASSNDYVVGKTLAPPASGVIYEGPAPTNVPEGPAPQLQAPPLEVPASETPAPPNPEPPPPHR